MTPRQETGSTAEVFVLRTFHVDHSKWERFGKVAEASGSSRAAELRTLIDRRIAEADLGRAA